MLKYIVFAQKYNIAKLERELSACMDRQWIDHFNKKDYNGAWQSIALRSASGLETDIYANYGVSAYQDSELLKQLPYIKSIIDSWCCEKETIRLLALHPGSEIKPHRDLGCNYKDGTFRLHIPILTNNHVSFTVGGENLKLEPGTCWYIDFTAEHSIKNEGESVRVHLVIDALRNEWTDRLFAKHGYNIEEDKDVDQTYDDTTKLQMIAELERMDTEVSRKLIADLKKGN